MSLIRRMLSRIAAIATTIIAAIPMSAISSSSSKDDPVAAATRFHTFVFVAYVVILVLAALFQWWVWSTGNRLQDAIRANSDARIAEAREATVRLEKENLTLRSDLNAEVGKVAILQRDASDAKASQQKVELELTRQKTELEKQKSKTVEALLEQEKLRGENIALGRKLEAERSRRVQLQRTVLHRMIPQIGVGDKMNWDSLKPFKGVSVAFKYPDGEPAMFSGSVGAIVMNAGWNFLGGQLVSLNGIEEGVTILAYVGSKGETDRSMEAAKALAAFMAQSGIEGVKFGGAPKGTLKPDTIEVLFGPMPDPFKNLE